MVNKKMDEQKTNRRQQKSRQAVGGESRETQSTPDLRVRIDRLATINSRSHAVGGELS